MSDLEEATKEIVERKASAIERMLMQWRNELDDDSGARAELRRCEDARDVMLCRGFAPLLSRLLAYEKARTVHARKQETIVEIAARTGLILCKFKALDEKTSAPNAMAAPSGGKPIVSPLRASVLFRSDSESEAARVLSGMASLMKPCNPEDIYRAMTDWNKTRRDWAMQYNLRIHDLYGNKA